MINMQYMFRITSKA